MNCSCIVVYTDAHLKIENVCNNFDSIFLYMYVVIFTIHYIK